MITEKNNIQDIYFYTNLKIFSLKRMEIDYLNEYKN